MSKKLYVVKIVNAVSLFLFTMILVALLGIAGSVTANEGDRFLIWFLTLFGLIMCSSVLVLCFELEHLKETLTKKEKEQ